MHSPRRRLVPVALLLAATLALAACGSSSKTPAEGTTDSSGDKVTLRLGYFPNVTHAPAIIGVQDGAFAKALGDNVDLKLTTYNSGTDVTTAILAGALDAASSGPTRRSTRSRSRTARSSASWRAPRRAARSSS